MALRDEDIQGHIDRNDVYVDKEIKCMLLDWDVQKHDPLQPKRLQSAIKKKVLDLPSPIYINPGPNAPFLNQALEEERIRKEKRLCTELTSSYGRDKALGLYEPNEFSVKSSACPPYMYNPDFLTEQEDYFKTLLDEKCVEEGKKPIGSTQHGNLSETAVSAEGYVAAILIAEDRSDATTESSKFGSSRMLGARTLRYNSAKSLYAFEPNPLRDNFTNAYAAQKYLWTKNERDFPTQLPGDENNMKLIDTLQTHVQTLKFL